MRRDRYYSFIKELTKAWTSNGIQLFLGQFQVGFVALVFGFELDCSFEALHGFLVLVNNGVGESQATKSLSVTEKGLKDRSINISFYEVKRLSKLPGKYRKLINYIVVK